MNRLKQFADEHPVLSYVLLCYGITWPIWFCVPLIAGTDWSLGKIVTGIGFGPALAVVVLDHLRGTGAMIGSRAWWSAFIPVSAIVGAIDVSSLVTGDAITTAEFAVAQPVGLSAAGFLATVAAAARWPVLFLPALLAADPHGSHRSSPGNYQCAGG